MSDFNVLIPKLGESIQEATITKLFVKQGDKVSEDDILFEVATDKVDSEIPSPVAGTIKEIRCAENDLIPVGQIVIVIALGTEDKTTPEIKPEPEIVSEKVEILENKPVETKLPNEEINKNDLKNAGRFYSPLVKSIATKEGVTLPELESITGSGLGGRVQKNDIISYIEQRVNGKITPTSQVTQSKLTQTTPGIQLPERPKVSVSIGAEDTILKMDRIRKLIANHMVMSKQVSPHVTTVVEADVTNLVLWRNAVKNEFEKKYGEKLTFMPLFTDATAKALSEFRQVNSSVDEDNIILRKHINIAIAVATNDGNLVVPVIKDADSKNLVGLSREINSFARAGRENKLSPDDLQGGTFTITNFGSFGGLIGTPIINQPQVAILAVGMIEKKPAVMETSTGDAIVVRHKMFLSLSYDHRVVDGMLGGRFLRRIADLLEQFEQNTNI
ncbi:MAG TPA: dihydrolipoamide acetyltransferase family protein [Paludibacter sp.]|nr:dihydrolipoamide acetyltransferase family protein [Prolixibacteraceae bacterium]